MNSSVVSAIWRCSVVKYSGEKIAPPSGLLSKNSIPCGRLLFIRKSPLLSLVYPNNPKNRSTLYLSDLTANIKQQPDQTTLIEKPFYRFFTLKKYISICLERWRRAAQNNGTQPRRICYQLFQKIGLPLLKESKNPFFGSIYTGDIAAPLVIDFQCFLQRISRSRFIDYPCNNGESLFAERKLVGNRIFGNLE